MTLFASLIAALSLGSGPTVNRVTPAAARRIDEVVENLMAKDAVPGMEVGVVLNGETVYECGYGLADPSRQSAPGPDTAFQIDSVTKSFTALEVLKLMEDGKLSLDDPVSKYLSVRSDAWKPLTLRQLITMTSGLPSGGTMEGTYQEVLQRAAAKGLEFAPGSQYLYSNVGYQLLGEVIAKASGQKYIDAVSAGVLEPLGMGHTGFFKFEGLQDAAAPSIDGRPVPPRGPMSGFAAGGFTSTIHDMERFADGLYRRAILRPETYQMMWTPAPLSSGGSAPFGMGWELRSAAQNGFADVVGKNGGGYGWSAQFNYYPSKGVAVIVLANSATKNITAICKAAAIAVTR